MIEKFKGLSRGKKIIVGIIAFMFFPLTIIILSIDLLIRGLRTKKIGKVVSGIVLTLLSINLISAFGSAPEEELISKKEQEQVQEASKEDNQHEELKKDKEVTGKVESKHPFGQVIEKPVMNGSKTEKIGTYAEVMAGGVEITKENIMAFYEDVVKDSGYNWVTLNIDGQKGIQFIGSTCAFGYGELDEDSCLVSTEGNGFISGDKIEYE